MHLKAFITKVFEEINPCTSFMDNWHIDAMVEYLLAVSNGHIKRLIINIPPRYMKSLIVSVAWPAWLLGNDPSRRIISASYNQMLSEKHLFDCRAIMQVDWYQRLYNQTAICDDYNTKRKFMTTKHGFRMATSIGGTLLGEGGNYLIVDDPHKPLDFNSAGTKVQNVRDWFGSVFVNRLDDKKHGVIVIVMQRLAVDDLTGHILTQASGKHWETLILPVQSKKTETIIINKKRFVYQKNHYLHPQREGKKEVKALALEMGANQFQAMYMQKPLLSDNTYIKESWLKFCNVEDVLIHNQCVFVHSSDIAYVKNDKADYTAYLVWAWDQSVNVFYLVHALCERMGYTDWLQHVVTLSELYPPITLLVEAMCVGAAVKDVADRGVKTDVVRVKPISSKRHRMDIAARYFQHGDVYLPDLAQQDVPWLSSYIKEITMFPNLKHDDQVDATSQFLIWAGNRYAKGHLHFSSHNRHVVPVIRPYVL